MSFIFFNGATPPCMRGANQSRVSPHTQELFVHHHNHDGHRESAQRWHAGDHRYVVCARGCVPTLYYLLVDLQSSAIIPRKQSQESAELLHLLETTMPGRDRNLRHTPNTSDKLPKRGLTCCARGYSFCFLLVSKCLAFCCLVLRCPKTNP